MKVLPVANAVVNEVLPVADQVIIPVANQTVNQATETVVPVVGIASDVDTNLSALLGPY